MAEALALSASSEEEVETRKAEEKGESSKRGAKKSRRISRAPVDSENSEAEREKCGEMEEEEMKATKGRKKSRRNSEKKEKRSKAVEKLKKERFTEMDEVSGAWTFNVFYFSLFINLCTY